MRGHKIARLTRGLDVRIPTPIDYLVPYQYPLTAAFGAFVLYLFGSGGSGQDFLDKRFPRWPPGILKTVTGLVVYVVIGGIVATLLADPKGLREALIAGWSWFGLLEGIK